MTLQYAERQLRYFTRLVDKLRLTSDASDAKEEEKGKETLPPAPPIEKRQKEKKGAGGGEDARAREVSSDVLRAKRKRETLVAKVAAYNAEIDGDVDAEYFVDYYAEHLPRNWQARLRNWLKEDKSSGRIRAVASGGAERSPRPTNPTPQRPDWTLCGERCANFCDGKCRCGIACPPACEAHPRPPEECAKFAARGS